MVTLMWIVGTILAIFVGLPIALMVAWQILGVIFACMKDAAGLIAAILFFIVLICFCH